jgi:hypothetical protein
MQLLAGIDIKGRKKSNVRKGDGETSRLEAPS